MKGGGIQILDPATGTGTFIVEIIKQIYQQKQNDLGMWENYVKTKLLPRLNAFEISMVSHTLAHLKVEMLLRDYKIDLSEDDKISIYFTNALANEKGEYELYGHQYLRDEIDGATKIKTDKDIKVIIGNPPYAHAAVKEQPKFIEDLANDYKAGANAYPSNDLYWMFIRLGEYYTSRQEQGIMNYITNNSYLNGDTHYKMREHLLKTYDKIYILDLHGEGGFAGFSKDKNVFNIQVGVAIAFFVKTGEKNEGEQGTGQSGEKKGEDGEEKGKKKENDKLAELYYYDIRGTKESKFTFLRENDIKDIKFQKLTPKAPKYLFIPFKEDNEYEDDEKFFGIADLMGTHSALTLTGYDDLLVNFRKEPLKKMIEDFQDVKDVNNSDESIKKLIEKYGIKEGNWTLKNAISDVQKSKEEREGKKENETKIINFNFRKYSI